MNRRAFLTKPSAPFVQTRERVMWRLASSFARSLDTIYGAAETLASRVEALTDGNFRIRVYPGGEMVPALEVLESVQKGTIQMGHTASYYYIGKNPALAFETCVPFGLTARQYNAWMEHGGRELAEALLADFNILPLPGGNTGVQMGGWFRREIGSLTDLNGLKMRIPGLGGAVMDRLGATVQVIAGGDIYPALERGTIDATEWVGPYDDEKLGFYKVAQNYYYPGWWEPGPALTFYVNRDAWDSLSTEYQQVLRAASTEAGFHMLTSYDAKNPQALQRLLASGVTMRPFPQDIMDAAQQTAFDIMEEQAAADATYNRVYTAFKQFREASYRWFNTTEQAYAAFVASRV